MQGRATLDQVRHEPINPGSDRLDANGAAPKRGRHGADPRRAIRNTTD